MHSWLVTSLRPWPLRARLIQKIRRLREELVKLLIRYVRFRHRRRHFTSLHQINQAIIDYVELINNRRHSRFGVSRRERFEALERAALKPLPAHDIDSGEWVTATLHPECCVLVEAVLYSGHHIHCHKNYVSNSPTIALRSS